jgi:phenylalanyl-tRNA synthetase beta chain
MEIDVHKLSQWYGKSRRFTPLPKFSEEKRDFAFVMNKEITCAQVENLIQESCPYVTKVKLFDVYEGLQLAPSKKSMAFSVVFTPQEEEFTTEKIDGFVNDILQALKEKYEITLRA